MKRLTAKRVAPARSRRSRRLCACLTAATALSTLLWSGAWAGSNPLPSQVAQADAAEPAEPVGAPPTEDRLPDIAVAPDVGGVLTPAGRLTLEPSLRFSHTSARRFTFRGIELAETVLVGVIEAEEAARNFVEAGIGSRLGITDRFEVGIRLPLVYRDDRVTFLIPGAAEPTVSRDIDAFGVGDIEVSTHYQLNRARPQSAIFVANLRGRVPTGEGPFDVARDDAGIETELPTGSGFYAVEPSVTVLFPADPVVFFINLGYQWNIARSVDTVIAGNRIGEVDPGDAIRTSMGMAFAITNRTSISFAYSHDFIGETSTEINGAALDSTTLHVGTFAIGASQVLSDDLRGDVTVEFGATSEATDASVVFRLVTGFDLF